MGSMTGAMQCFISMGSVHIAVDPRVALRLISSTESTSFRCLVGDELKGVISDLPVESVIAAAVTSRCLSGFVSNRFGAVSVSNESLSGLARRLLDGRAGMDDRPEQSNS